MSKLNLALLNVTKGTVLPDVSVCRQGDMFYKTDVLRLYVFNGSIWEQVQGSGSGGEGDLALSLWLGV